MRPGTASTDGFKIVLSGEKIKIPDLRRSGHEELNCSCQQKSLFVGAKRTEICGVYLIVDVLLSVKVLNDTASGDHRINDIVNARFR